MGSIERLLGGGTDPSPPTQVATFYSIFEFASSFVVVLGRFTPVRLPPGVRDLYVHRMGRQAVPSRAGDTGGPWCTPEVRLNT